MSLDKVDPRQISFEVKPHPAAARRREGGGYLDCTVAVAGRFGCTQDLNAGDEVTVTIADADGNVIASGTCEAGGPSFPPIKAGADIIGTERRQKVKLTG